MASRVFIIGGGLAGLAAASRLGSRGVPVTLLESRPRLGGRASSFTDQNSGETIDNCQHVSMGCCTNFRHFLEQTELAKFFRTEQALYFVGPNGAIDEFTAGFWPAPLHLLPAFSRLRYLTRDDRRHLTRGLRELARWSDEDDQSVTFLKWLEGANQPRHVIDRFWHVVLVSALSESLDRISVRHARKVFVDAFLAHRRGWEVQIPTVPLDELYGRKLTTWMEAREVAIRLKCGVKRIVMENDQVRGVELRTGEVLAADHCVLAVPHHRVLKLLPDSLSHDPQLAKIDRLEAAPISSVHLWFDRSVTDLPHAVLIDRLSQWMFNRTVIQSRGDTANSEKEHYYQVVISASRDLAGLSQPEIISQVVAELQEIWPSDAQLKHGRVVTEHQAVFSVRPGVEECRPNQQTPVENLQLAGDWTKTGWPATMEGAVRSGYLAADNVLEHLGLPRFELPQGLPVSWLSRLLLSL